MYGCGVSPRAGIAVLGTVLLGACAVNPVTHRPELVLMSAAKERELGAEQAKQVEQSIGFAGTPELTGYVTEVGTRVAAASPRSDVPYAFHIIDMEEPNAFALPNGDVYVSRGMLALLSSEDELAGVLGHEVGHIAARHSVQRATRAVPLTVVTGLVSGVTGLASPLLGNVVGGMGQAATGLVVASYSRDQERQADELGQQFAAASGWSPAALSQALDALERSQADQGAARRASFFDSHPSTPERVERAAAYARTLPASAPLPDRAARLAFAKRLDGLVIGIPASQGVIDAPLFLHPDLDLSLRFPDEWRIVNGRREVSASAPQGRALVVLDAVAQGDDPQLGAQALERQAGAKLPGQLERLTINGNPAARTRVEASTDYGPVALYLTWIAYQGRVYQITGLVPVDASTRFAPIFESVAGSFRSLTAAERASLRETRLRLIPAQAGETPAAIAVRTDSPWSGAMIAAANGTALDAPFAAGDQVKVAISEPYRP